MGIHNYRPDISKIGKKTTIKSLEDVVATYGLSCSACNKQITKGMWDYSMKRFGKALCIEHQKI